MTISGAPSGPEQLGQEPGGALAVRADHDPVRVHEVEHRRAFAQELRVGRDVELDLGGEPLADDPLDEPGGADRNGALVDDDLVVADVLRDVDGRLLDVRQVRAPVFGRRGRHADEDELRLRATPSPRSVVNRSRPASRPRWTTSSRPGSWIGIWPPAQLLDLLRDDVDAGHFVTEVGEAGAGDETDVPGAHDRDLHARSPTRSRQYSKVSHKRLLEWDARLPSGRFSELGRVRLKHEHVGGTHARRDLDAISIGTFAIPMSMSATSAIFHARPGADVVDVARLAAFEREPVRLDDVAHVAEVALGIEVARR